MFDLNKEWSISFAGCGFMGIYYIGAISCISEWFPQLFQGAVKIYGASSGALIAAILANDISLGEWVAGRSVHFVCFHISHVYSLSIVCGFTF